MWIERRVKMLVLLGLVGLALSDQIGLGQFYAVITFLVCSLIITARLLD